MNLLLFTRVIARCVLVALVVFLAKGSLASGEARGYPGPDRKFLAVSDLVGSEKPESIGQLAGGAVEVIYRKHREYFAADGTFLGKIESDGEIIYSPVAEQLIDFGLPGVVSVRAMESGDELARYPFAPNETKFFGAFTAADGKVCIATSVRLGAVGFDPLTGEILWADERVGWNYSPVGEGAVVVRFTHLVFLPEQENQYYGPVSETLHTALTGELVLPEEANSGFLVPGISLGGQAVYVSGSVTDAVWLVDTASGDYKKLDLAGREVSKRVACQSISGDAIAVLAYEEEEGVQGNFQFVVWKKGEVEGESLVWNEEWGDPDAVVSLSISDDGLSVVFGLVNGAVYHVDTAAGGSKVLLEGHDFDPVPALPGIALGGNVEVPYQRVLADGGSVLVKTFSSLRVLDVDTGEALYQQVSGLAGQAGEVVFLSSEKALIVAADWTLRTLDLATWDLKFFGGDRIPRIVGVWPFDEAGLATVFFADGSNQAFDAEKGMLVGERSAVMPFGTGVLGGDAELGLLVGGDGRVYKLGTDEVVFDIGAVLESDLLREEYKAVVRKLLVGAGMRAELLGNGEQVAFFDVGPYGTEEPGDVLVFDIETGRLVAQRQYDWVAVEESDEFIVALERSRGINRGWDSRVGVFDRGNNLAELYGVAVGLGSSVKLAPDGRHFAVLSSDLDAVEGDSMYEVEVVLREFALERNGFSELEPTIWKETYRSGEFDLGAAKLLEYNGPGKPVAALALRGQVLEMRRGVISEWREEANSSWFGSSVVDRTADGRLLVLDPFGRLGIYATFLPRSVAVDVAVSGDGFVVLDLSDFDRDRIDVWQSSDLKVWQLWDWVPVKVTPEAPVFNWVIEWVEEG